MSKVNLISLLRSGVASLPLAVMFAVPAYAQAPAANQPAAAAAVETPATDEAVTPPDTKDIVVTGTQIRGIAPVGANTRTVTREQIELSGATDTQAILGTLPQTNTFMAFQNPGSGVAAGVSRVPINLPNLRNLPQGSTGNPTTLVMMDGHRIVPSGIEQSAVDAGIVPSGIIDRSEIILDGVSSLYGSDAHGGVINFITRKRFNGLTAAARYGFADDYWSVDADVTAGKMWDSGGFAVTYNYAKNSPLFNIDRPNRLSRNYLLPGNPFTGTACEDHSTITAGGALFTVNAAAITPQTTTSLEATKCANNAYSSFVSGQERHGALAAFSQDITDTIKFEVTGLYSRRNSDVYFGPFTTTETAVRGVASGSSPVNPYFRSLAAFGTPNTTTQSIAYSYGPVLGTRSNRARSISELWQVTPTLSVNVGSWQVRALAAYGESAVVTKAQTLDTTLQAAMFLGATTATTNNPYDPASSGNIAQINSLIWTSTREGDHKFLNLRLTADGPLFTLPGGDVTGAVGVEYIQTKFAQINTVAATHLKQLPLKASTKPKSIFAEINVPIFSKENRRPGFETLTLAGSARYDDYQEYGTTFNPKVSLTYEPISGLTFRGNYGTSFRAPTAVNKIGGAGNSMTCFGATGSETGCLPASFYQPIPPNTPIPAAGTIGVVILGSNEDLKPETAKNWAVGVDFKPSFIPGLKISSSYYHIALKGLIGIPSTGANGRLDLIYLNAPQLVILNPTAADLAKYAALAPINGAQFLQTIAPYKVAYFADTRTTNLGGETVSGVDMEVNYVHPFDWGSIDASINGTWRVKDESKFFADSAAVDTLVNGVSRFRSSATLGVRYGSLRGQVVWQHSAGFPLAAATTRLTSQTSIPATDFFNLSFRYTVKSDTALFKGIQLTAVVNNVFDKKETINLTTTGGTAGGSTLGRFFQFGISKAF